MTNFYQNQDDVVLAQYILWLNLDMIILKIDNNGKPYLVKEK